MSGMPKAAVLPVPVLAWPMTSWPSRASGISSAWIGDGLDVADLLEGPEHRGAQAQGMEPGRGFLHCTLNQTNLQKTWKSDMGTCETTGLAGREPGPVYPA